MCFLDCVHVSVCVCARATVCVCGGGRSCGDLLVATVSACTFIYDDLYEKLVLFTVITERKKQRKRGRRGTETATATTTVKRNDSMQKWSAFRNTTHILRTL